jgi:hypothetical protein
MAIGLGKLRSAGRRRAGRGKDDREPARSRSTVREVCLIGLDRRATIGDWTAGQEVTWLGRKYQVRATAGDSPEPTAVRAGDDNARSGGVMARQYIHLTSSVEE